MISQQSLHCAVSYKKKFWKTEVTIYVLLWISISKIFKYCHFKLFFIYTPSFVFLYIQSDLAPQMFDKFWFYQLQEPVENMYFIVLKERMRILAVSMDTFSRWKVPESLIKSFLTRIKLSLSIVVYHSNLVAPTPSSEPMRLSHKEASHTIKPSCHCWPHLTWFRLNLQ